MGQTRIPEKTAPDPHLCSNSRRARPKRMPFLYQLQRSPLDHRERGISCFAVPRRPGTTAHFPARLSSAVHRTTFTDSQPASLKPRPYGEAQICPSHLPPRPVGSASHQQMQHKAGGYRMIPAIAERSDELRRLCLYCGVQRLSVRIGHKRGSSSGGKRPGLRGRVQGGRSRWLRRGLLRAAGGPGEALWNTRGPGRGVSYPKPLLSEIRRTDDNSHL